MSIIVEQALLEVLDLALTEGCCVFPRSGPAVLTVSPSMTEKCRLRTVSITTQTFVTGMIGMPLPTVLSSYASEDLLDAR